ncbi:MAG: CoA transferase [Micromonosporaceae bacterium]|nr:CoA transferase [Micromonosporaceae bacterium]
MNLFSAVEVGALAGLRVIEMGTMMAGPVATTLLSDFGAEVVKLEPRVGDPLRGMEPQIEGVSAYWLVTARNKRSVVLDARDESRRADFFSLTDRADVLVENFRAGTLESWGVGPDVLLDRNPRLVIVRVTGFGQEGPNASLLAYDRIVQLMSGLASVTGFPESPPTVAGFALSDQIAALFAAFGALLGLAARDSTGEGQVVDVASLDCLVRLSDVIVTEYDRLGIVREREGNSHPSAAPMNMYQARDGAWVYTQAPTNAQFKRLAKAIDRPNLPADPRFCDNSARFANRGTLDGIIQAWVSERDHAEVLRTWRTADLPAAPVRDAREVAEDPGLRLRGAVQHVDTPVGPTLMQGIAPKLSRTPGAVRGAAPALDEDSVASVVARWSQRRDEVTL